MCQPPKIGTLFHSPRRCTVHFLPIRCRIIHSLTVPLSLYQASCWKIGQIMHNSRPQEIGQPHKQLKAVVLSVVLDN